LLSAALLEPVVCTLEDVLIGFRCVCEADPDNLELDFDHGLKVVFRFFKFKVIVISPH